VNEGAKFWLQILTELGNREVKDISIAYVDEVKGFPQAIETVLPQAQVQLCIVRLVRASLNFVGWRERKTVAQDLKSIYRAVTEEEEEALREMAAFAERWNHRYPTVAAMWHRNWERIITFVASPAEVRKIIYTTDAMELLIRSLRKSLKTRVAFPVKKPRSRSCIWCSEM